MPAKSEREGQSEPAKREYWGLKEFLLAIAVSWPLAVLYSYARFPNDPRPLEAGLPIAIFAPLFLYGALFAKLVRPVAYHRFSMSRRKWLRAFVVTLYIATYLGVPYFCAWPTFWFGFMLLFNTPVSALLIVKAVQAARREPRLLPRFEKELAEYNDNELYGRRLWPGSKRYWWW